MKLIKLKPTKFDRPYEEVFNEKGDDWFNSSEYDVFINILKYLYDFSALLIEKNTMLMKKYNVEQPIGNITQKFGIWAPKQMLTLGYTFFGNDSPFHVCIKGINGNKKEAYASLDFESLKISDIEKKNGCKILLRKEAEKCMPNPFLLMFANFLKSINVKRPAKGTYDKTIF